MGLEQHELPVNKTLGETIPPDTDHAVSVSLPSWAANVGYEEGSKWVTDKMKSGYPRFYVHGNITALARAIVKQHGNPETDTAMLVSTRRCAEGCANFLSQQFPDTDRSLIRIHDFVPKPGSTDAKYVQPCISAVIFPSTVWPAAKMFWQHTGEGVSSRRAEFCHRALDEKTMVEASELADSPPRLSKGPRRYQRPLSIDHGNGTNGTTPPKPDPSVDVAEVRDSAQFVEERFGRNLDVGFAAQARLATRKRIAGSLTHTGELPDSLSHPPDASAASRGRAVPDFSADDVYLYPGGMNAIYHAHLACLASIRSAPSVMYGFPYVDTLKVLQKFGPGAIFYGQGSETELDDLEARLESGEKILSLFCEFPGNPLLKTPDLARIRRLADKHAFAVVVDETIGNFLNIDVLPSADILVSSLTKTFSGDSNVMAGSLILNPRAPFYTQLKTHLAQTYEDNLFPDDAVYLERNSRDFASRTPRINANALSIATLLSTSPHVKNLYYPSLSPTRHLFDAFRLPSGGYGGLLSATFHSVEAAAVFYDALETCKGPSLGTNFTLSSPFVLLAHFGELEWAAGFGCEASLVRFSVGLEEPGELKRRFEVALEAVARAGF